jgi:hypothetical protein
MQSNWLLVHEILTICLQLTGAVRRDGKHRKLDLSNLLKCTGSTRHCTMLCNATKGSKPTKIAKARFDCSVQSATCTGLKWLPKLSVYLTSMATSCLNVLKHLWRWSRGGSQQIEVSHCILDLLIYQWSKHLELRRRTVRRYLWY